MPSSTSALLQIVAMATGENQDTWGTTNNANLTKLENAIASALSLSSTGGTTTLTTDQARNAMIVSAGVLASDHTVVVPAATKAWIVRNNHTLGGFALKFKTSAGTAVTIPQSFAGVSLVYCDGAEIYVVGPSEATVDGKIQTATKVFTATVGGTANAITLDTSPAGYARTAGNIISFVPGSDNTGAVTVDPETLGGAALLKQTPEGTAALSGGELQAGNRVLIIDDGSTFQLIGDPTRLLGTTTDIASASTTDLGTVFSHVARITGTTTITAFGSTASTAAPIYFLRFSGILTLTHNGTSLIIPGAVDITTAANDTAVVEYLGSGNWRVLNYQKASISPVALTLGGAIRGLSVTVSSNTALTVAATSAVLYDGSNNPASFVTVSESIATGSTGAGGLDTGTMANSTWYAVWLIGKSDGTIDAMLSTSGTSPTMPSGYTYKLRVGWVRTDGAAALLRTKQVGNKAAYTSGTNARQMTSGASGNVNTPTWTTLAVGDYVPTTAVEIILQGYINASAGGTILIAAPNDTYGQWLATSGQPPLVAGHGTTVASGHVNAPTLSMVLESTNIYYAQAGTNSYLNCLGWVDSL